MLKSMTGFGSKEIQAAPFGKISVEIRSTNHKFLDAVFHLPEGFLSLEDAIKRELEAKIKRGRVTCAVNIIGGDARGVFINKKLVKNYLSALQGMKREHGLKDDVGLDTLVHLPGVVSLSEARIPKERIWPAIKSLLQKALEDLNRKRENEGRSLFVYLKAQAAGLDKNLIAIKARFARVIKEKAGRLKTDEERSSFLKDADINEELARLAYHFRNFKAKLSKAGPVGKELDFIAQEMQREANTIAAKSCDTLISGRVVQMKSQIEKIREQAQNVE